MFHEGATIAPGGILSVMAKFESPLWWTVRRAQNRKPSTYRCPFCGQYLPALSEHMLIAPEGDPQRRRHAHTECVLKARAAGRLPTREEWLRRSEPAKRSSLRQILGRLTSK
jgi:hypothetical protein